MPANPLQLRQIADTSIYVSPVGLGTVKLGRDQGVKYPTAFVIPSDKEASNLISCAKELGINLIDTAPAYGNSEERLGYLLKGQRQDWVICSKVGEEFSAGISSHNFTPAHAKQSIERSLQRLNTDYIDMVLVHSDGKDLEIIQNSGLLELLAECKKQGTIRSFGMSTKTLAGGLLAAEKCDVVMLTYNLTQQEEKPILDFCQLHHKAALIKKAYASGHLSSSAHADPVQASLELIFSHPGTTSVIIGTINQQHLKDNVAKTVKAIASARQLGQL